MSEKNPLESILNIKDNTYHIGKSCLYGTVKIHKNEQDFKIDFYIYQTDILRESHFKTFLVSDELVLFLENYMPTIYTIRIMKFFYEKE